MEEKGAEATEEEECGRDGVGRESLSGTAAWSKEKWLVHLRWGGYLCQGGISLRKGLITVAILRHYFALFSSLAMSFRRQRKKEKGGFGTNCPSFCLLGNAVLSRPTDNCFCPFEAAGAASLCFSPCLHPGKKDGSLPLSCLKDTFVNASVVLSPFSPKK